MCYLTEVLQGVPLATHTTLNKVCMAKKKKKLFNTNTLFSLLKLSLILLKLLILPCLLEVSCNRCFLATNFVRFGALMVTEVTVRAALKWFLLEKSHICSTLDLFSGQLIILLIIH